MQANPFELSEQERNELAPNGSMLAGIAVGPAASAVWCVRDAVGGEPRGVTVMLAREIARRCLLSLQLVEFASSGDIVANADKGSWTLSFVPIDDERRRLVAVGPNYYLGVSTYLTRADEFRSVADVDASGVRVAGIAGTATFRSAQKSLHRASIEAIVSLDEAVARFRNREIDALALGKESILSLLADLKDCHAVEGHFHEAGTAVVVPKLHTHALVATTRMIEAMKADGTIRRVFDENRMPHAAVAP